ncbi:hypothetical protein [Desulfoscipio gibsoniae]|uniref:Uncharacterized protein n=1 Tax=Desulfoscipio gibsoniae DSM 7213 TaxID=767817 RepID=R4KTN7_9FIRM|nr:hypothetical protein [Desulfoscipio gibsoniae]AGL02971.1 hypothetical protein Desgi_3648 [Desulfoscipio gibsoniae DSM 7213]
MEVFTSIACALLGLVFILMFLMKFINIISNGVVARKQIIICLINLLTALLLLHFHFEIDI